MFLKESRKDLCILLVRSHLAHGERFACLLHFHIHGAKDQSNLEIRGVSGAKAVEWQWYGLRLNAIAVAGPKDVLFVSGVAPSAAAFVSHCCLQNTFFNGYEEMEMPEFRSQDRDTKAWPSLLP